MSEQLQDEAPVIPAEAPSADLQISADGQIEAPDNVIDLTDNKPATDPAPIQPEGQSYTYGGDAGDRKIGDNPNDRILQLKAQGNYPNSND